VHTEQPSKSTERVSTTCEGPRDPIPSCLLQTLLVLFSPLALKHGWRKGGAQTSGRQAHAGEGGEEEASKSGWKKTSGMRQLSGHSETTCTRPSHFPSPSLAPLPPPSQTT